MPRWLRIVSWVGALLVVVLIATLAFSVWTVRRSFPQTGGTLKVEGLDASVQVVRDGHGIPQLYAETSHDLFLAQGYVQAQDRFFEMDFRRHVTAGRLAELFGQDALKTDKFVRTLGWRRVAEEEYPLLDPDTQQYLDAFAQGVNAYLAERSGAGLSLEYAVLRLSGLDYEPEPWTPGDSLAWLKAMAWDLRSNIDDEVTRAVESPRLSDEQIAELYPAYPYADHTPIVTTGGVVGEVFEQDASGNGTRFPRRPAFPPDVVASLKRVKDLTDSLPVLLGTGDGIGSNAWAVSGEHTSTGMPILANDPHLGVTMPGVFYQMGLHCKPVNADCPFDVSGFTFAGMPGVIIGHNDHIAWGFTNLYADVMDLYLEKVEPGDRYVYGNRTLPLTVREETFEVAGQDEPVTIRVRATNHGPLISDVSSHYSTVGANAPVEAGAPEEGNGYAVALRWTALQPGRTADSLFNFDLARSWDDFRDAARDFQAPSQNLVYADVEGHIGYQAPGQIPIRRTGTGDWPAPGWDPAYDWADAYVPFDALPNVFDPDDGYVITANQAVIGPDYPYYVSSSYDYGYRAERIRTLLEADDSLSLDDMSAIQLDTESDLAKTMVPYLLDISLPTAYYRQGENQLRGWDLRMAAKSSGAAYFNVVWRQLLEKTFHDELPEDAWPAGGSRWWYVVEGLLKQPRSPWWDDIHTQNVHETRDDILAAAMQDARDELTRRSSRSPSDWEWGQLHRLELEAQSLGTEDSPVAFLLNRGGWELGGGPAVVDAISWDSSEGYAVTSAPAMRMVVSLGNLDDSRWINLTGASGHAYNAHYTDQTDLWADGQTLPWLFSRNAVEDAGDATLTLQPPG